MHLLTNITVVISLCSPWTEAELAGRCSCNAGWHELECWLVRALLRVNLNRLILMITNRFCFRHGVLYVQLSLWRRIYIRPRGHTGSGNSRVLRFVLAQHWSSEGYLKLLDILQVSNRTVIELFFFWEFYGHNTQMFTGRIISRPQSRDLPLLWLEWFFCKNDLRAIRNGVYKHAPCRVFRRCQVLKF